ncbi:hypothetical protein PACTADRAFT_51589 [Pachysolen tannophilus NRRL Y-2460]|uniref:Altered inheritance of mitochondria protein 9, mitochondrial n=1 Tax=Pachysolen tannophilus NRRL Y-2460 TaxID=669874 RepID=A0A1E4TQ88_PACTA|nr:hypothetical protein PACTADRAFT_51589 [Pachysolen tannophilus NRRL Y-2460]
MINLRRSLKVPCGLSGISKNFVKTSSIAFRLNSTTSKSESSEPKEVFTKLSDEKDPQRNAFFQYSWGSWLKNDKQEKERRTTRFSIEGCAEVLDTLVKTSLDTMKNLDKEDKPIVKDPKRVSKQDIVVLSHNVKLDTIGSVNPNEKILIKKMLSIHEGKHHRIYKLETSTGKNFILRIPYPLDAEFVISKKIQSEVATMDFLDLKLGLKVPKVYAYGVDSKNPFKSPFILMEYLEGPLLMKQWNPLESEITNPEAKQILKKVIDPIANFQDKMLSVEFNGIGSLYFRDDVDATEQIQEPYSGETKEHLKNRWCIGPLVERVYFKNKKALTANQYKGKLGPYNKPLDIIKSVADIELENLKTRLSLADADSSPKVEDKLLLKKAIEVYEKLLKVAPLLFNPETKTLPNAKELFKPRLFNPDLDPMNVILQKDSDPYFVDFESSAIKPFILQSYPRFIAYEGPKIYNLTEDVENFDQLSDVEKQEYEFMYNRTRNQFLWEYALNERRKELLGAISPAVKALKSPYIAALENKTDKDYLYVESALINLEKFWQSYLENGLVGGELPYHFSEQDYNEHVSEMNKYQEEIVASPFTATKGWVPQDMFTHLLANGFIVKDKNGDHYIDKDKILQ